MWSVLLTIVVSRLFNAHIIDSGNEIFISMAIHFRFNISFSKLLCIFSFETKFLALKSYGQYFEEKNWIVNVQHLYFIVCAWALSFIASSDFMVYIF